MPRLRPSCNLSQNTFAVKAYIRDRIATAIRLAVCKGHTQLGELKAKPHGSKGRPLKDFLSSKGTGRFRALPRSVSFCFEQASSSSDSACGQLFAWASTPSHQDLFTRNKVKCAEAPIRNNIGTDSQVLVREARKATRPNCADSAGMAVPFSALSAVQEMIRF